MPNYCYGFISEHYLGNISYTSVVTLIRFCSRNQLYFAPMEANGCRNVEENPPNRQILHWVQLSFCKWVTYFRGNWIGWAFLCGACPNSGQHFWCCKSRTSQITCHEPDLICKLQRSFIFSATETLFCELMWPFCTSYSCSRWWIMLLGAQMYTAAHDGYWLIWDKYTNRWYQPVWHGSYDNSSWDFLSSSCVAWRWFGSNRLLGL